MAAHQQSLLFSASNKTNSAPPATSFTFITDEDTVGVIPQAASAVAALDHVNAGLAVATNSLPSSMCRVQMAMGTGAHNSIFHTSASETGREPHPSPIPCTSDGDLSTSTHSSPRIHDTCCSSKRTIDCAAPRQVHVAAAVDNELGSVVLQAGNGQHILSPVRTTRAHEKQSPSKKLNASKEESSEKVEKVNQKDIAEEAGEVDQAGEVEEEGCVTPTARDQRIPQYDVELNAALECPPAPKKKPCTSKRRRLFNYSTNIRPDAGAAAADADNFNYHVVAERRAFLVDPPDLHNFPDCIRALFK